MGTQVPELKELRKMAKQLKITTTKKKPEKLFEEILDAIEKGYGSGELKADDELVVWFNDNAPEEGTENGKELEADPEPVAQKKSKGRKKAADKKATSEGRTAKEKVAEAKAKIAKENEKEKATTRKAAAAKDKTKTAKEKVAEAKKKKAEEREEKKKAKAAGGGRKPPKREGPTFYDDVKTLIEKATDTKKKGIGFDELLTKLQNKWPEKNEASLRNTIAYLKIKGVEIKQANNVYSM